MELRDYLRIISKRVWLLVGIILVFLIAVYAFTITRPKSWDGSVLFNIVKRSNATEVNQYTYDQYYAIQASSLFADTVISWLQDPYTVISIYKETDIDTSKLTLKNSSKIFTTRKIQPAGVQVKITSTDQNKVGPLLKNATLVVQDRVKKLNEMDNSGNFVIDANDPVVIDHRESLVTNIILALVAGLLVGLSTIFVLEYLDPKKK